jgi:hypothetical protein
MASARQRLTGTAQAGQEIPCRAQWQERAVGLPNIGDQLEQVLMVISAPPYPNEEGEIDLSKKGRRSEAPAWHGPW